MSQTGGGSGACRGCGGALIAERLDLGGQPLCNRFAVERNAAEPLFPVCVAACGACGLLQLVDPAPARETAPRFDWISYSEPEAHLDAFVADLVQGGIVARDSVVGAVSYKDASTLARLAARGVDRSWQLDPSDLGLPSTRAEVDAVQDRLDPARALRLAGTRSRADLLLVRHVLEHAHDLAGFLEAVSLLVKPGGRLIFEVPDARGMLTARDYAPIWEEHVVYFTPETLAATLTAHGFEVEALHVHEYAFENAIVARVRRGRPDPVATPRRHGPRDGAAEPTAAITAARAWFSGFAGVRERVQRRLEAERAVGGRVALLGAGHLGVMFVNLMGIGPLLDCAIDDDPRRSGLLLPGSRLPILPSSALADRGITLCLLAVNPLAEDRVVERNAAFTATRGSFRSIFPVSARALREVRS